VRKADEQEDKKEANQSVSKKDEAGKAAETEKNRGKISTAETKTTEAVEKDAFVIKGFTDPKKALIFNPEYINFMKDFQMVRFMNMSGMTRNPVVDWDKRNTLKKASTLINTLNQNLKPISNTVMKSGTPFLFIMTTP